MEIIKVSTHKAPAAIVPIGYSIMPSPDKSKILKCSFSVFVHISSSKYQLSNVKIEIDNLFLISSKSMPVK